MPKKIVNVTKKFSLVPKARRSGKMDYEDLKKGEIAIREKTTALSKKLSELRDSVTDIESAIKLMNEAGRILADMFGVSTSNISMRTLSGARLGDNNTSSEIRNGIIDYVAKIKGLRIRNTPNATDIAVLRKALDFAKKYGYEQNDLVKRLASERASLEDLELKVRSSGEDDMRKLMKTRVHKPGLSPLEAARNVRDVAREVNKEIGSIETKVSDFLLELSKVKTLKSLSARGVDVASVKVRISEVTKDLAELEAQAVSDTVLHKSYEKKNSAAEKANIKWRASREMKLKLKFRDDKKKLREELAKLDLATKSRLDLLQGRIGLSGLHDRSTKISDVNSKIATLKASLSKLMLEVESFSVNLGNKSFEAREHELREFIKQGQLAKKIKTNAPQVKNASALQSGTAWLDAVKSVLNDPSKVRSFPSISTNMSAILVKKTNPLELASKYSDAREDIQSLIGYGSLEASKWLHSNFKQIATELALASVLVATNPGNLAGIKRIDVVINEYFAKIKLSFADQNVLKQLEHSIHARLLSSKTGATRGLNIDVSSKVYVKNRARAIVGIVRDPSFTALNGLRSKLALAFRQQLNDWVMRNVRIEGK